MTRVGAASPEEEIFRPLAPAGGRKIVWGGEYLLAASRPGVRPALSYAAMVSKSSLALLLDGLAPSTVSRCWRASSLRPR